MPAPAVIVGQPAASDFILRKNRKKKKPNNVAVQQGVVVGCLILLAAPFVICAGILTTAPKYDPKDEKPGTVWKAHEAWAITEQFITDRVKSPSTADFGGTFNGEEAGAHVSYDGDYKYTIVGWVDAQNGFGATVRAHFAVKLLDTRDGKWRLLEEPTISQR